MSYQQKHLKKRKARTKRSTGKVSIQKIPEIDRVTLLMIAFVFVAVLISFRLFIIQVVEHSFYEALASGQHELVQSLLPERGEIYAHDRYADTGLSLIATNQTKYHVYLNPRQVTDPQVVSEIVSPILGLDPTIVLGRAEKKDDLYEPLKHQVTDQEIEAIERAMEENSLDGVHWTEEDGRYYSESETTSAITGFIGMVDDQRVGQYGLEGYFNEELAGQEGSLSTELDASGRFIAVGEKSIVEAQDGDTLILTIDMNIQYKACSILARQVPLHNAKQGSIIVMDPKTGAIMAMCNYPTYDPNNYSDVEDIGVFINDAISDQYEPGSVFKPLAMAAAVNDGHVTPYTTYEDTGSVKVSTYTIRNSDGKAHGVVDMTYVLEHSLNTGAIFAVNKVGNKRWHQYVQDFGFGQRTDISLGGENFGDISEVAKEKDIYSATSSYGQGLTVTPIQLAQAFGALANDGYMMKPYIVDRIVKPNGYQEATEPELVSQVVTPETARTIGAMMVRVIDGGHAIKAAVDGYFMAGKTGTAQIPKENGTGYDPNRHKDTFVGFGPVSDPQFVILIKIDEPTEVMWSAASTAPIYGELAQYLVNYLQIPPDRTE